MAAKRSRSGLSSSRARSASVPEMERPDEEGHHSRGDAEQLGGAAGDQEQPHHGEQDDFALGVRAGGG